VLLVGGLVLATITVLSVLSVGSATRGGALDPENPAADGARAVARVLADHGVEVSVVRRATLLDRTPVDADTTVLVTSSESLGRSTAGRLQEHVADAGAVVLPAPASTLTRVLDLPLTPDDVRSGGRTEADCADPLLSDLTLAVPPSEAYRSRNASVTSCFSGSGRDPAAWVVRVDGTAGAGLGTTYVVGAAALFTNERVDDADNAAVALRLLGQHDRLVWYVPDVRDVAAGDAGSLAAQLPGGLVPALGLLGASVLATMLWRGRRLGPLVVEPLPVVVKAVESTQGRGRLYRRVRDRPHAAAILRDATARRLATRLRLPAGTDPERLAAALAEATGTDPRAAYDVLVTRPVTDDRTLTRLQADLTALEREVHP
jgi:hypothetical protein